MYRRLQQQVPLNARQYDCGKKTQATRNKPQCCYRIGHGNALDVRQWLMSAWVTSGRSATPRDARFTP